MVHSFQWFIYEKLADIWLTMRQKILQAGTLQRLSFYQAMGYANGIHHVEVFPHHPIFRSNALFEPDHRVVYDQGFLFFKEILLELDLVWLLIFKVCVAPQK